MRLYPSRPSKGQSFVGVKRCVVPNQSMTLQEILRRFVKREELPIARKGMYEERFGDLEKLSKADITVQMEEVERIKADLDLFRLREEKRIAKRKADAAAAAAPPPIVPPVGGAPAQSPPPKGA